MKNKNNIIDYDEIIINLIHHYKLYYPNLLMYINCIGNCPIYPSEDVNDECYPDDYIKKNDNYNIITDKKDYEFCFINPTEIDDYYGDSEKLDLYLDIIEEHNTQFLFIYRYGKGIKPVKVIELTDEYLTRIYRKLKLQQLNC